MYSELTIVFCLCSSLYFWVSSKKILNPIAVFNSIWVFILFLESFHYYGLFTADERIYQYIFIGVMSINIGYFFWYIFRINYNISFIPQQVSYTPRIKLLYFLSFICILFFLSSSLTTINLLLSGNSLGFIRSLAQQSSDTNSLFAKSHGTLTNAIFLLVINPTSMAIQIIASINFWAGKRDKILFCLAIILVFLTAFSSGGGRTSIVNFLIYSMIGYTFSSKIKSKKSKKSNNIIFLLLGLGVLVAFTISRAGQDLFKGLYLYFSMEPYMFSIWASIVDGLNVKGFGEAATNGFSFVLFYLFKNVLGIPFPEHWNSVYTLIRETDSNWQIITNIPTTANAYVSGFWYLYLDGGLFAIISGMLLYGTVIAESFFNAVKKRDERSLSLFALMFQGLFFFFIRFPFSDVTYCLTLVYLFFILYKRSGTSGNIHNYRGE